MLAGSLTAPPAHSQRTYLTNQQVSSRIDPDEKQRHPRRQVLGMVLNEDHPNGARVCVGFSHTLSRKKNKGKVSAVLRVFRSELSIWSGVQIVEVDFGSLKLRGGSTLGCEIVREPLEEGDGLEFEFLLTGRTPIRAERGASAGVYASVTKE